MKIIKFKSMAVKISLIFTCAMTLLMLVAGLFANNYFRNSLETEMANSQKQLLSYYRTYINDVIENVDKYTLLFYTDNIVSEIFQSQYLSPSQIVDNLNLLQFQGSSVPLNLNNSYYTVSVLLKEDPSNTVGFQNTPVLKEGMFSSKNFESEQWYQDTLKKMGSLNWFTYSDYYDNYVCFSRFIKNTTLVSARDGVQRTISPETVIVMKMDIKQFMKNTVKLDPLPDCVTILVDQNNEILYLKDETGVVDEENFDINNIIKSTSNSFRIDGKDFMLNKDALKLNWTLFSLYPKQELTERIGMINLFVGGIVGLVIVLGLVTAYFVSMNILSPIRKLAEIMNGMKSEKDLVPIKVVTASDEIEILYKNFNYMINWIRRLVNDVFAMGLREKDYELQVLRAQINPHFIWNTLDTINWTAIDCKAKKVSELISKFSNVLRYSIKYTEKNTVLFDEIEAVKDYIIIQKACYNSSFDVTFDVAEETLSCRLPKLSLQPLVENSIFHGLACNRKIGGGGIVKIFSHIEHDKVKIIVSDNGVGCEVSQLNYKLNNMRPTEKITKQGIMYVHKSIHAIYGDGYGLRFELNEYKGVDAIITIPRL